LEITNGIVHFFIIVRWLSPNQEVDMTCVCFRHLTAVQYLKIYLGNIKQISLQISVFKILSCVLSCFLGFSANSFLRFNFVFQKSAPFRTLLIAIYTSTNRSDILKIVENNTKQAHLDCLSFFLDFVSATP
jgi:hypothetical protein